MLKQVSIAIYLLIAMFFVQNFPQTKLLTKKNLWKHKIACLFFLETHCQELRTANPWIDWLIKYGSTYSRSSTHLQKFLDEVKLKFKTGEYQVIHATSFQLLGPASSRGKQTAARWPWDFLKKAEDLLHVEETYFKVNLGNKMRKGHLFIALSRGCHKRGL